MYKVVIGLEVHCELKTKTKNFSGAANEYSLTPNVNVATVDMGFPGILPVVNKEAIKKSLKVALALNCKTPDYITFDRKNYFYPDLPKGYQITQSRYPVGVNGYLMINVDGVDKKVLIHDTHLEEDTASLDHYTNYSLIDYNRAGVPLLETVTEPVLNSSKEAIAFLEALRSLFLYCGVSEARSDRGQMRCDVNVSLMEEGSTTLGTRVEMKNINSFNNVKEAIECEIKRQTAILESGGKIVQETRRYDDTTCTTYSMREKVDAVDYKYFAEANIPPIKVTKEFLDEIKAEIPLLGFDRVNKYMEYGLSRIDANTLVKDKKIADYFEECIKEVEPKLAANWINGSILSYLNKNEISIEEIFVTPSMLTQLIKQVIDGKISNKQGKEVLNTSLEQKEDPIKLIEKLGLKQVGTIEDLRPIAIEILDEHLDLIEEHRKGRNVFDFFVGQIMKKTRGQANPTLAAQVLKEEIEKR